MCGVCMCVCVYPEQFLIEYCLADRTVHRPRVLCSSTVVLSTARVATMAKGKAGKALAGKAKCKVGKAMKGMKAGKAKGKAGKAKGKAGKAMKAGWKKVKDCATQALDYGAQLMETSSMQEAKHSYWCVSVELLEIRREALRQLMLKGMKAGKAKGKAGKAMKAGWKKVKACATQALDFGAELMKTSSMKEAKHLYFCVSLELGEILREALRQLML